MKIMVAIFLNFEIGQKINMVVFWGHFKWWIWLIWLVTLVPHIKSRLSTLAHIISHSIITINTQRWLYFWSSVQWFSFSDRFFELLDLKFQFLYFSLVGFSHGGHIFTKLENWLWLFFQFLILLLTKRFKCY